MNLDPPLVLRGGAFSAREVIPTRPTEDYQRQGEGKVLA
jgi:hypothetical protein